MPKIYRVAASCSGPSWWSVVVRGGPCRSGGRAGRDSTPPSAGRTFRVRGRRAAGPAWEREVHPELTDVVLGFERAQARLHALADALPPERWAARADPTRWSVAECVAHLNLTSRAYLPLLHEAIADGRQMLAPAPLRYRRDPVGWLLSNVVGPLPRIAGVRLGRVRTKPPFVPGGDLPRDAVLAEFDRLQREQIECVEAAEDLPLQRLWIRSPFDARVRHNVYSCLVMLPRHQERHVEQAEAVWGGRSP